MGTRKDQLVIKVFQTDYPGAMGQIFITLGRCNICDRQPVHVMHMDASEETFDNGSICLWCIEGMFVLASRKSGPPRAIDYMKEKTPKSVVAVPPHRPQPPPIPQAAMTSPPLPKDKTFFATAQVTQPIPPLKGTGLFCSICKKEVEELWIDGTCMDCTSSDIPAIPPELLRSGGK